MTLTIIYYLLQLLLLWLPEDKSVFRVLGIHNFVKEVFGQSSLAINGG